MQRVMNDPVFQEAAENAYSLMTKILSDIPAVHKEWIHSRIPEDQSRLQYLKEILDISTAPVLQPLSDDFTLETCLSRIVEGLKMHRALLKTIGKLIPVKSVKLNDLLCDIRDLLAQIHKMQNFIGASESKRTAEASTQEARVHMDMTSRVDSPYTADVAGHLVLDQLQNFGRGVTRSLRSIISST